MVLFTMSYNLRTLVFIKIFLLGLTYGFDLDYDLRKLSQILPGVYSNKVSHLRTPSQVSSLQYLTSATSSANLPLDATYRPVEVMFLSDAYNVYVEHTINNEKQPYRQWLYSFTTDSRSRTIRLKVYTFRHHSVREKVRKNPRSLKYVSPGDVTARDDCDMHWRRLATTFIGTTSKRCEVDVKGQRVRISVVITLNQTSLQIDEGWYKVKDGSKVIEMDGPVILTKLNSLANPSDGNDETKQQTPKDVEGEQALQQDRRIKRRHGSDAIANFLARPSHATGVTVAANKHVGHRDNIVEESYVAKDDRYRYAAIERLHYNRISEDNVDKKQSKNTKKNAKNTGYTSWKIQTYSGIIDALKSGHKLYMTVNMKRCSHTDRHVDNRVIFGDYVDVFRIGKDFDVKQPHAYVKVSLKKLAHTNAGFTDVLRDVTAFRNGTVRVMTALRAESGAVERYSTAYCRLQDQDTRRGDVRFYLNPLRDVQTLPRYGSLRAALKKGRMVRVVADLARCSGGSQHELVGAEVRAYDINKRSIEFSMQDTELVQDPNGNRFSIDEQYMVFELTRPTGGVVTLHTRQPANSVGPYSVLSGFLRLRCETEKNSSTRAIAFFNT